MTASSATGATALGALVSGFAVRILSLRVVTIVGLVGGAVALVAYDSIRVLVLPLPRAGERSGSKHPRRARMSAIIPLVDRYIEKRKPKESKPPRWLLMISLTVAATVSNMLGGIC